MLPFPTWVIDAVPSFVDSRNVTLLAHMTPTSLDPPFYHTTRQHLFDCISDRHLSMLAPFVIYWVLSSVFHWLDTMEFPYFEARRIHDSEETKSRNRATVWQVIRAVVFQQIVQTITGLILLESDENVLATEINKDHLAGMKYIAPRVADLVILVLGRSTGLNVLHQYGPELVNLAYWWGIPTIQMFLGL
jgi:sphinganine C4-monooxygenase